MEGLHFLRPYWFAALPLLAFYVWRLLRQRAGAGSWFDIVSESLRPYVLETPESQDRMRKLWLSAVSVAGVLAITALAGPAWQKLPQPVFRSQDGLVIALDLSRSMDSTDLAPSRLTRARLKLLDILAERTAGQTALVAFAGDAFTVSPLTDDTATIAAQVPALATSLMPSQGSNLPRALELSRQLLGQAGIARGRILLITDDAGGRETLAAARDARSGGATVSVLGVGTAAGAPIPERNGGFVTDSNGKVVVPKLAAGELRSLADAGGGRFSELTIDSRDIGRVLAPDNDAAGSGFAESDLSADIWREEGPWLVLLLLPLVALVFRRGVLLVALVFVLPVPNHAYALEWSDLWLNRDQRAERALESGDADKAVGLFRDDAWRSAAQYRAGKFADSAESLQGLESPDAHYNRGNALAKSGDVEQAIAAYQKALELEPDHEDARYNLDLLEQMQDQQQQQQNSDGEQQQQQQQDEQQQSGGSENDSEAGGSDSAEQQDAGPEPTDEREQAETQETAHAEPDDGQQGEEGQAQPSADDHEFENDLATEQWLRRIPDDPGGLLRRKFRYQYLQRQQRRRGGEPEEAW